jgi:hypothetical protein
LAKDLRRQVNDPKAQELTTAHEKLAVAIQKRLDEQVPPLAPQKRWSAPSLRPAAPGSRQAPVTVATATQKAGAATAGGRGF